MTLTQAYLTTGVFFALPALALLALADRARAPFLAAARSLPAAILTFGGAAAWFLWNINNLSESDFAGFPRNALLGVFGGAALLAFFYLRDHLAARGLGILLLLSAQVLLDAGYMHHPYNLLLSIISYLLVICGIYLGIFPYRLRDWTETLLATPLRARLTATVMLLLSILLFAFAFRAHTPRI